MDSWERNSGHCCLVQVSLATNFVLRKAIDRHGPSPVAPAASRRWKCHGSTLFRSFEERWGTGRVSRKRASRQGALTKWDRDKMRETPSRYPVAASSVSPARAVGNLGRSCGMKSRQEVKPSCLDIIAERWHSPLDKQKVPNSWQGGARCKKDSRPFHIICWRRLGVVKPEPQPFRWSRRVWNRGRCSKSILHPTQLEPVCVVRLLSILF